MSLGTGVGGCGVGGDVGGGNGGRRGTLSMCGDGGGGRYQAGAG